ncbi:ATP-binding protein [Halosimplex litoreum]|uniref:ATP-binding protein n=1 Tax=Halosimplex litoreum TaxID=1198301 RepID=A0A7T3FUX8_9EURY|nr:ATP-binding protein [Halosimplex litoreum]QPV61195.1 ATP-binding protein [Halosimplex litoreum]
MSDLGDFTDFDGSDDGEGDDATGAAAAEGDAGTDGDGSASDSATVDTFGADEADDDFAAMDVTPAGEDRGVGVVSATEGLRISEDGEETELRAYVTVKNRSDVRIGKYLLIPYQDDERLFCRITALEYAQEFRADDATEIHARRAMRRSDIDEQDFKFVATLDPLAVLYSEGDELKRRMTDRVPKPETVVREATNKSEIKTGLKIPEDGVFLGHLSVGGEKVETAAEPPHIDYRLKDDYEDGDPLVFRHTLVAGGTGSGKTHSAKNVLRQYLADERTYPVEDGSRDVSPGLVMFDPQDEYAQMHDDNPDLDSDFARRLEREGIAYGGVDDTIAFVPKVQGATYATGDHRAEQVEFTIPFSMVQDNPWLIAGANLNGNQYNALQLLLDRFSRDYGSEGTYQQFKTFLDDPALREELDETGRVHEATFNAVKRRALGFDGIFDQDARPITERVHEFVRAGGISVVPTYHINNSRTTVTVVLALAALIVDQKLSNDPEYERIKNTPLVLGLDEAHNFLSEVDSVQGEQIIGKFTEAAKQGRKERLGLFLITQDPQDIADPVFKQINSTVVLNLGDDDAISAVNIPANLEQKVPYMEKGQKVVYSPDNSEPVELIGLSKCLTNHE